MKRSELQRRTFGRSEGRGIRRPTQPRRDWTQARKKVEREGTCRLCDDPRVEAAHVIGREHDEPVERECPKCHATGWPPRTPVGYRHDRRCSRCDGSGVIVGSLRVEPDRIIPLCRAHHTAYDHHEIEVLPVLSLAEQLRAVEDAGGIELARMRTAPLAYREVT